MIKILKDDYSIRLLCETLGVHRCNLDHEPRPSRHEEPVIEHVRAWATHHGFELRQDAARNLVVDVPATPGRESAPLVTLQGHLDMVCERQPDSPNDPAEGRIGLLRDGEWLTADGTTLGADEPGLRPAAQ